MFSRSHGPRLLGLTLLATLGCKGGADSNGTREVSTEKIDLERVCRHYTKLRRFDPAEVPKRVGQCMEDFAPRYEASNWNEVATCILDFPNFAASLSCDEIPPAD